MKEEEQFRYRQARNIIQANRKPVENNLPPIESWNSSSETFTSDHMPLSSSRD
jgi:hypothetical protein